MKRKYLIPGFCILLLLSCNKKEAEWIASTPDTQWQRQNRIESDNSAKNMLVIEVDTNNPQQKIDGFGACFNEIGWDAIQLVDESKQQEILNSLFDKEFGLNFNFCRTSVAANDYSRDWYSYNETDGDFEMKNFSIERDKEAVIPYIKAAFNINPDIKLWASPWSVPTWMKTNKFYANKAGACNGLNKELEVPLYNDQVIQNPEYLQALALYFVKYLDAYKNEGINISMIMYQNEAFTFSEWPNGSWTPEAIANFNGKYLGPTLARTHPDIYIFFGTLNTSDPVVYTTVLEDPEVRKYIKGIGVQWEGRDIFPSLKDKYPDLKLMQTESECGWGNFSWKDAEHTFNLMKHYFDGGANSYMCWNMVLQDDGISSWCWKQN